MELRTASSPRDVKTYDTQRLREEFLIDDLFRADDIKLVYSHIDRIITGSAVPVKGTLALTAGEELRAQYFLERRELGVINIGGEGTVTVDGTVYTLRHRDGLYVGRGSKDIVFASRTRRIRRSSTSIPARRTRRIRRCTSARRTACGRNWAAWKRRITARFASTFCRGRCSPASW